jgi:hypothetical protein
MEAMNNCQHLRRVGDNYGESCADCGKQLRGYGYGGWFGVNLTGTEKCIHLWSRVGEDYVEGVNRIRHEVCVYCEEWREEQS